MVMNSSYFINVVDTTVQPRLEANTTYIDDVDESVPK